MADKSDCLEDDCGECESLITWAYQEMRGQGYSDREAFMGAVRQLELRHPGHERYFYFQRIARWLAAKSALA